VVDITRPRDPRLLALSGGSTALPIMELGDGRVLKESLVLLRYLEERFPVPPVARADPYERAVERMLIAREGPFTAAGYGMVMNRDRERAADLRERMLAEFAAIDGFLRQHNPDGVWLFDRFGLAEVVFTPLLMRFWFLDYYEGFALPATGEYDRVARWRDACLAHPAAQQVSLRADRQALLRLCGRGRERRAARGAEPVELRLRAGLAGKADAAEGQVRPGGVGWGAGVGLRDVGRSGRPVAVVRGRAMRPVSISHRMMSRPR
jgi:glutathione S-transferase